MKKDLKDTFVPVYWKNNLQDVEDTMALVKRGKVTELLKSAGKRPVYMVEYGKSTLPKSQATLSSALGARDIRCYADKTRPDYVPTVFFVGCMHGGEWEGTVGLLNLIKLLETGTDYAGNPNDKLVELCSKVHLVLIPMANPDGRSHIPFDNFVGKTFEDLRYYNQGTWLDGTLCGWPECKKFHPIKPYVDFLGGYYNDDGVNMMHDDYLCNPSNEVKNVLIAARDFAPDMSLLFHGGTNSRNSFFAVGYLTKRAYEELNDFGASLNSKFSANGQIFVNNLPPYGTCESTSVPSPMSLPTVIHHVCGEPAVTYESNQGLVAYAENQLVLDNDNIYKCHMLAIETTIEWVLNNKSAEARASK